MGKSLLSPGNPMRGMSARDIATARQNGVDIDRYRNPNFTGKSDDYRGTGGIGALPVGTDLSQLVQPTPQTPVLDGIVSPTVNPGSGTVSIPQGMDMSSYVSDFKKMLQDINASNNSWSAAQAQKQMDYQTAANQKAMQFNHDEAELSRKWQEYMSSTAHQREIKDLQTAGLNPVLSALGGSGAPVTSGATASGYTSAGAKGDTDMSTAGALVSLLGSMLGAQTQLASAAISARTQEAVADKYTAMDYLISKIQQDTSLGIASISRSTTLDAANINAMSNQIVAKIHAGATISSAQLSAEASKVAASIHAAAQRYGYDVNAMTQSRLASFNAQLQKELQERGFRNELSIQSDRYGRELQLRIDAPSSVVGAANTVGKRLADLLGSLGDSAGRSLSLPEIFGSR